MSSPKKVFVSYSHHQGDWVWDRLVPVLKAGGAEVLIDRERFEAGRGLLGQMDATQDAADVNVLVLSPDYLASDPCRHEMERAIARDPRWGEGGIERIHAEPGGWPHLVQLVAETVVDLVNDAGGASVDTALLERALDRAVVRGNNVFLELVEKESRLPGEWDYLRVFRSVEEQLVPAEEAVARSLRRRRLVLEEDGRYRLRVPLMGRWLRQQA